MDAIKLKPCPFCSGDKIDKRMVFNHAWFVCKRCGAKTTFLLAQSEEYATEAWNRRADGRVE